MNRTEKLSHASLAPRVCALLKNPSIKNYVFDIDDTILKSRGVGPQRPVTDLEELRKQIHAYGHRMVILTARPPTARNMALSEQQLDRFLSRKKECDVVAADKSVGMCVTRSAAAQDISDVNVYVNLNRRSKGGALKYIYENYGRVMKDGGVAFFDDLEENVHSVGRLCSQRGVPYYGFIMIPS